MKGARDEVIGVLSGLPEDASLEDIRYEFEVIYGILEGTRDSLEGRTHTHAEVMEMVRQWRSNKTGRTAPAKT
jgi:predicted transcriptional regulator